MVILLGASEIEPSHIPVLVNKELDPEDGTQKFVFVGNYDGYTRKNYGGWLSGEMIHIPLQDLSLKISESAWLPSSFQFQFLGALVGQFDEKLEFPSLARLSESAQEGECVKVIRPLIEELGASMQQVGSNVLMYFEGDANEKMEVALLAKINAMREALGDDFEQLNFFIYSKTLSLMNVNITFQQQGLLNVIVFPVELAAILAIFHEIYTPGMMRAWLLDLDRQAEGAETYSVESPFGNNRSFRTRAEVEEALLTKNIEGVVVGLRPNGASSHADSPMRVFVSQSEDRRHVWPNDEIVLLPVLDSD